MNIKKIFEYRSKRFNQQSFFALRESFINSKGPIVLKLIKLYKIRRIESLHNAQLGVGLDCSAEIGNLILPHGIDGVVISPKAKIGKNCMIYHNVTIGQNKGGAPTVGDNCFFGVGATVIGPIKIGNNARIGAGCVVVENVPENATVVMQKPRTIIK